MIMAILGDTLRSDNNRFQVFIVYTGVSPPGRDSRREVEGRPVKFSRVK
jgi:hypothetical protein